MPRIRRPLLRGPKTSHARRLLSLLCPLILGACSQLQLANTAPKPTAAPPLGNYAWEHLPAPLQPDPPPVSPWLLDWQAPDPATPDIWDELRAGFALHPETSHPRVKAQLNMYLSHPRLVFHLEERVQTYLPFVLEQVRARGLPLEVALLPFVESSLDPYAFSHGGAAGLWQLIPATARRFGVAMDYWYDGRRDLVDSTQAALDYLEFLHGQFDDWLLAMAAYNAGEGRIRRALRQSGADTSFWDLPVPRETAAYVPRILALSRLIAEAEHYQVALPIIAPTTAFVSTELQSQVDLRELAELAEIPVEAIFRLNPGLNHGATPPALPHRLLVPSSHQAQIEAALASFPPGALQWHTYEVKAGDTLGQIARRFGTNVADIQASNRIQGNLIRPGDRLMIPQPAVAASQVPPNPLLETRRDTQIHVVQQGESLWLLANRYNTSVNDLVRINRLNPRSPLQVGQRLEVPATGSGPSDRAMRRVYYQVRPGDSLARIADRFNVSVRDIVQWNQLDPARYLQPGQRLLLMVDIRSTWSA